MRYKDRQIGKPDVLYKDTKSNIEALTDIQSGAAAYATDSGELGLYNGTQWVWFRGDMLKSVYDTNNNGVVDSAESVAWSGITGKPSTFPPSTHTHPGTDITSQVEDADKLDGQHGSYYTSADNIYFGDQRIRDWMSFLPQYTIRDHFTTPEMNSSYWTGWTVTPAYAINYNYWGHFLRAAPSGAQVNQICFLYKYGTTYPIVISTQCAADSNNVECGVMYWQDDNNYIQLFIKAGVGTYSGYDAALFRRSVISGTVTTTQISSTFPGGGVFSLRIYYTGSVCYGYASSSYIPSSFTTSLSFPPAFTPTRWGIFVTNLTNTGPRAAFFNQFSAL